MQSNGTAPRLNFYIKIGIFLVLLLWLGFFMAEKIDLTTADLGRHIKNGELLAGSGYDLTDKNSLLFQNFYSYTNPDFPFTNHHWASGVIFFWVYKIVGFAGLSIFYILLSVATFSIFFFVASRESDFSLVSIFSFLLIPLIAERREIRPEIFSYFFAALFFLLLWLWRVKKISWRWLLALPVIMVLWVNLHVYFFLGIVLVGFFLFAEVSEIFFFRLADEDFGERIRLAKGLFLAFVLTILGTLVNPFGFKLLLHPLNIYKNYGYTVLEEKSVWFLENYGIANPNFLTVKAVLVLFLAGFFLLLFINRKKISVRYLLMAIFFGAIGWMALRNFSLLGLFALPVLAYVYSVIFRQKKEEMNIAKENGITMLYIVVILLGLYINYQFIFAHSRNFGIGLRPGAEDAANFFREKRIAGPIFNDYDIGGYLIWNLYPQEKVFVDNRPEVYPHSFFSEVYKPMQDDPDIFRRIDQEYNFNSIFFYKNDITPWGMNFMKNIKENQEWAKAFEDDYAVIYLKKNETNKKLIEDHPK